MATTKLQALYDEIADLKSQRLDRISALASGEVGDGNATREQRRKALGMAQQHPDVVDLDGRIRDLQVQRSDLPEYHEDVRRARDLARQQREEAN